MADNEIQRGQGGDPTAPPLEQGAATQVNEAAIPPADDLEEIDVDELEVDEFEDEDELGLDEDESVETPGFAPKTPEDRFLLQPGRGIAVGQMPAVSAQTKGIPRSLIRQLPVLRAAAKDPTSSPILRGLYRHIVDLIAEQDQT